MKVILLLAVVLACWTAIHAEECASVNCFDQLCCGNGTCYNPDTHNCLHNTTVCAKTNNDCKKTVCFDPNVATCFPQPCGIFGDQSQDVLCGKGLAPCQSVCFDPNLYVCENGTIIQRTESNATCGQTITCTGNELCCGGANATCYDPTTEVCAQETRGTETFFKVCPISSTGKAFGLCNDECFDQDLQACCFTDSSTLGGTIVSINESASCLPNQCAISTQSSISHVKGPTERASPQNTTTFCAVECENPGDLCCGERCYSPETHDCLHGTVLCAKGNNFCGEDTCFDPNTTTCFPQPCGIRGPLGQDLLCGRGLAHCEDICFDPVQYECINGSLFDKVQNQTCGENGTCSEEQSCCQSSNSSQCYDAKTEVCAQDPRNAGVFKVCPISASGKAFGICEGECFDQDEFVCCSIGNNTIQLHNITSRDQCVTDNDVCNEVTPQDDTNTVVTHDNGGAPPKLIDTADDSAASTTEVVIVGTVIALVINKMLV